MTLKVTLLDNALEEVKQCSFCLVFIFSLEFEFFFYIIVWKWNKNILIFLITFGSFVYKEKVYQLQKY